MSWTSNIIKHFSVDNLIQMFCKMVNHYNCFGVNNLITLLLEQKLLLLYMVIFIIKNILKVIPIIIFICLTI